MIPLIVSLWRCVKTEKVKLRAAGQRGDGLPGQCRGLRGGLAWLMLITSDLRLARDSLMGDDQITGLVTRP